MVWGIFPLVEKISWEGHLFGALAGILIAVVYRREGPQRKLYQWEIEPEEDDDDDDENAYWKIPETKPETKPEANDAQQIQVTYTLVESKRKDDSEEVK